jgi:hypothetical protein
MWRFVNWRVWWMSMSLALGAGNAAAFSLLGPPPASGTAPDGFQQPVIAYHLGGDIGGPKNLGEEYRWNTPNLFYAFDASFLDYFGSNGVFAIEQAIAIFNNLTNFSAMSADLSEFPLEVTRQNYRASALNLMDLKSVALSFILEELGLTDPVRYTWCLRDRRPLPNLTCPFMHYDVIMRNFDPVTLAPSRYVNGTLYSYFIVERCTGPNPLADAIEFLVDPLLPSPTAVAELGLDRGDYYIGLTRDDVGGLRYMLRTNNMNWEGVSSDSLLLQTNFNAPQILVTSNLALFAAQALTNNAAALQALYPGLIITDTKLIFTNVVTTNYFAYFTNFPWSPAGSPASLVVSSNLTTNVATWFRHTFANVMTNKFATNGIVQVQTTRVEPCTWGPAGMLCTNVTLKTVATNALTGDFFILPTNSPCGVWFAATQLITLTIVTNEIVTATNVPGVTNVNGQQFTQAAITYFTNYYFVIYPVDCVTNSVALRQGMDTFRFYRANYDSLLGRFFQPITNIYTLVAVTNSTPYIERFQRVVTRPDFLFTAEERMEPDQGWHGLGFRTNPGRGSGYVTANIQFPDRVDGPGTREPRIEIEFNKVGPMLINTGPFFLEEVQARPSFVWGSFDGSTNAPVVYPSFRSLTDLENQVLILFSPAGPVLPDATVGAAYNVSFSATGGQPPYTWSPTPGAPGLPPGLSFSTGGVLSGVPTMTGTFDFSLRLSDSGGRVVDRPYTLTVRAP